MIINRQKLREIRLEQGFSQKMIAEICNTSISVISDIETGKIKSPRKSSIIKIADALEIDINLLLP